MDKHRSKYLINSPRSIYLVMNVKQYIELKNKGIKHVYLLSSYDKIFSKLSISDPYQKRIEDFRKTYRNKYIDHQKQI